jgi:hypothetical protein
MKELLVIIPCGKSKIWNKEPSRGQVKAKNAYTGSPFKVNKEFAENFADRWIILSARYGFIDPDTLIMDYEETFLKPGPHTVKLETLIRQINDKDLLDFRRIICIGGKAYQERAAKAFGNYGISVEFPAKGMPIGKSMGFIKRYDPFGGL